MKISISILTLLLSAALLAQSPIHNNMPASGVLGQQDFSTGMPGTAANMLNSPSGAAVDPQTGKLFIADRYNNRVLRWNSQSKMISGSSAEAVFGQQDFRSAAAGLSESQFNDPLRVFVDGKGSLWVSDYRNNRVLRFDNSSYRSTGSQADGVLGQADFVSGAAGTASFRMNGPAGIFVDRKGTLWVADRLNHRVLRFDNAGSKPNGANADGVLGQADFRTADPSLSASGMNRPMGVYADVNDHLWVCEDDNNRVLRFDAASLKGNGAQADGVLGQPDFTTNKKALSRNGVSNVRGVYGDEAGRLYIADESNNRILVFSNAASKPNGAFADYVLGRPDFGSDPVMQQEVYDPSSFNYQLFLPRDTSASVNGKFPLIISLHGIGESGSDLWKLKNEGLPKILDGMNSFPFIVASPQCPSSTEWYYDRTDIKLDKFLDSIIARYPVDTSRIYLTGYSMGGIGIIDFAIRHPGRAAALLPAAFRIETGWDVCRIKDIPMWAFHGALDNVIPAAKAQAVIDALKLCGGNPIFTVYSDQYHDSWTRTYSNSSVYDWLLTKKKQK